MTTVSGKIEDLLSEDKKIQGELKTLHYIVVGGKKYNVGFYPANYGGKKFPAAIGDDVTFQSEFKFGENKCDYTTLQKTGAAVAREAVAKAAPPIDAAIVLRRVALECAVRTPIIDLPSAEGFITTAKVYEAYLLGE